MCATAASRGGGWRRCAAAPAGFRRCSWSVRRGRDPCLPSPGGSGLSHVQKHVDEEAVVPGGPFELAPQRGFCVGMSTSNIEGKSAQNSEVGRGMVFPASRLILVENHVQRPVQDVFDAPMFSNDAQPFP